MDCFVMVGIAVIDMGSRITHNPPLTTRGQVLTFGAYGIADSTILDELRSPNLASESLESLRCEMEKEYAPVGVPSCCIGY